jgi:hypothetical protein
MKVAVVKFSNGDSITTNINGTDEQIKAYYLNNYFDMGIFPEELMLKPVSCDVYDK